MSTLISASEFAKSVKNSIYLFKKIWKEGTTMLLHAPRAVNKTDDALDAAVEITSKGYKVAYVSTSSSLDDFSDRITGISNLSVLIPGYDSPEDPTDYADHVISSIEDTITNTDIRIFIIDSVSRIAALSFGRNSSPAYVMKRLVTLQLRTNCSFLIISHDSTKSVDRALLNLADTELAPLNDEQEDTPGVSAPADTSVSPSSTTNCETVAPTNLLSSNLSRRERRMLQRQARAAQKHKK